MRRIEIVFEYPVGLKQWGSFTLGLDVTSGDGTRELLLARSFAEFVKQHRRPTLAVPTHQREVPEE